MFIPFALLLYRRRGEDFLPRGRAFALPKWLGWGVNIAVVLVTPVLVTFFTFPPLLPVTGTNMSKSSSFGLLCMVQRNPADARLAAFWCEKKGA